VTVVDPTPPIVALPPAPSPRAGAVPAGVRLALPQALWAGLVAAFAATCWTTGLPTDRVVLLGWVLAGLLVHAAARGWRPVGRLLAAWLPLVVVLLVYDASRGLADGLGMPVHVEDVAAVDLWLGGGTLPTVWLQATVDSRVWEAVAAVVYGSHFVVTPLLLAVLWVRNRPQWGRFVRMLVTLSLAGLVTYVLVPAAPPWLAAKEGVIEPVARLTSSGWHVLGLPKAGALLADSQGQVNLVAAVPSLHTAFAVLVCLFLLPSARRTWQRGALVAYAVAMPLVLVWGGEHYVIDTLLGALYAAAVVLVLRRRGTGAIGGEVAPPAPTVAA
jgi:PAP2 superfamily